MSTFPPPTLRGTGIFARSEQEKDDIIFGSTKKKLCTEFEKMMHKKFQMSSNGEITFFLGLYYKGQRKLGLWYPKDLPFDLVAYTKTDYAQEKLR
ncbi:hypothetical protein Tco_0937653 [Tanacetum coccineum]|uniref:Reverse transcriptase n=1 Tax=Tanacetum coccineum TaxID=301880 RepID=A0ABQ5DGV1_9ASTR